MLNPELLIRLCKYINGISKNEDGKLLECGGTENHIHLLISLPPKRAIIDFVRVIKTNSSKWLHEELSFNKFGWQNGYGFFSVSYSELEKVRTYIQNQADHHKKISFKEEFLLFLKKNCIAYDENYIWK